MADLKYVVDLETGIEGFEELSSEEITNRDVEADEYRERQDAEVEVEESWQAQLNSFINGAEADLSAWPNDLPANATLAQIINRQNLVVARVKKDARFNLRLAKYVRDNAKDTSA